MKKLTALSLVLMLFFSLSTNAFSWDHYRFHGGHYYHRGVDWGLLGFGALATGVAVGAYVASLPPHYETVVVNGTPYYYSDGYYYQTGPNGYVVVQPPAGADQQLPSDPSGSNPMMYIIGTLVAILLVGGIGLVIKKLFTHERRMA